MKLKIQSLNQITNTATNWNVATNWLIEDYIPEQSFGCLVAPSNSYKSFQAVDFACSVATGTSWNGKQVEQGKVLYFAGEGQSGINKRIAAWDAKKGLQATTNVAVYGEYIDLMDHELVESIITLLKNEPVKLMVLDTLARCFSGEENSAKDVGRFVAACDRIKQETGTAILVVHHTGKDTTKGARGSSALYAAMDYELVMERKANLQYSLRMDKQKDAEEQAATLHDLTVVELGLDTKGKMVTSLAPVATSKATTVKETKPKNQVEQVKEAYLAALENGDKTRSELKELVQAVDKNRTVAIKQLEAEGLIDIDKTTKMKDHMFSLPNKKTEDPYIKELAELEATLHQKMILDFELADSDYLTRTH